MISTYVFVSLTRIFFLSAGIGAFVNACLTSKDAIARPFAAACAATAKNEDKDAVGVEISRYMSYFPRSCRFPPPTNLPLIRSSDFSLTRPCPGKISGLSTFGISMNLTGCHFRTIPVNSSFMLSSTLTEFKDFIAFA